MNNLVDFITRNIARDSGSKNIVKSLRESKELSGKFLLKLLEAAVIKTLGYAPMMFDYDGKHKDTLD